MPPPPLPVFTGIIECSGEVAYVEVRPDGARFTLRAPSIAADTRVGDSLAVNGVCLTVVENLDSVLAFDAVTETLRRTNLGTLRAGDRVNLERPLRADGRFDGHIVQGHVDGTGTLSGLADEGNSRRIRITTSTDLLRYVVEKGSIAVDGISLTVAAVGPNSFEVVIIPHTWEVTSLSHRAVGDALNLEVDLVAKYVERLLGTRSPDPGIG